MRRHLFSSDSARRALGMTGIVGFVALALCSNANVLTRFQIMNTGKAEDSLSGTLQRGFHPSLGYFQLRVYGRRLTHSHCDGFLPGAEAVERCTEDVGSGRNKIEAVPAF